MSNQSQVNSIKGQLTAVLAEDQAASYTASPDGRHHLVSRFLTGFKGFDHMTLPELIQSTYDAGLADKHAELVKVLEAAVEQQQSTAGVVRAFDPAGAAPSGVAEFFPGASVMEIGSVMMQDIVGEYDVPSEVPAWAWIERMACYRHVKNGLPEAGGVWEFVVNLSCQLPDMPEVLGPVFAEANKRGLAYLVFHQGT